MRFLTKPVRNLLLATVFGTALVLVETEPVLANYPDCPLEFMGCLNADPDNIVFVDAEAIECYFGYVLLTWDCIHMDTPTQGTIVGGGQCFAMTPSGTYLYCDQG